jgi:RimJ/RimL family protein N-acetyltransferase
MSNAVPTIETKRLILRAHESDDFASSVAMWAHPITVRFIQGQPSTENRTWFRMLAYRGLWDLLGYGYWAITEKSTLKFVGDAGLADFCREIEPSIRGIPEVGWALAPEFHGQGYATEAVQAVLDWADKRFERTVCLIGNENAASLRVAEKLGFKEFKRTTHFNLPTVMLERLR